MRINQIARKHGLENKDIIKYLESIGIHGKSHSSSVDEGEIELLLNHFGKLGPKVSEPKPEPKKKFARIRRPKGWKPPKEEVKKPAETVAAETVTPSPKIEEISVPVGPEKLGPVQVPPEQPEIAVKEQVPAVAEETAVVEPAEKKAEVTTAKKSKKQIKRAPKTTSKKSKLMTIPLDASEGKTISTPEIIIEAPDTILDLVEEEIEKPDVIKVLKEEKETKQKLVAKPDQDEAIRREIQKLKRRQQGKTEKTDADKTVVSRPGRYRVPVAKGRGKRAWKREKRERLEMQIAEEEQRIQRDLTVLKVHEATTVADIANGLDISPNELIGKLIELGVMATVNQHLDMDTIQIVADEYNFQVDKVDLFDSDVITQLWEKDTDESRMVPRPPVVTIMGHVDHGKTKLLDAVRKTDVVSQEAGGITQHIGAYYVKTKQGEIVFLDTPGHEAFTAMRARGAMVTDIVILVVAATEGVMPQTIEAINHAKAAEVPIIVAINKIDLDGANPDLVKQQMSEQELVAEDWGGDVVMVPISAKQEIGIDDLLEAILLQAEILELKADPDCRTRGTIIEGRLEQGRGPVATVLLQQGQLKIGEPFVTGVYSGRIRAMMNDRGEPIEKAGPSMPVEILGLEDVPSAGDPFIVVKDDAQAKQISTRLQQIQREREMRRIRHVTLEDLHTQIEEGEIKELMIVVKGDVQGSIGALCENLTKIESDKVRIQILHSGVGSVTESDVMLASASNALIIGFNVRPHPQVVELAKREHVDIRLYRVIYDVISDIRKAMTGMLDKTFSEKVIGRGEIREVFRLSRGISIAGSYVQDGRLLRNASVRLLRDSVVIHEGRLSSLKRFKDDVREVASGYECGIGLERFNDIRVGDVVECFQLVEEMPVL